MNLVLLKYYGLLCAQYTVAALIYFLVFTKRKRFAILITFRCFNFFLINSKLSINTRVA